MRKNLLSFYKLLCACLLLFAGTAKVHAQLPAGFVLHKLTGNVINEATAMAHAPDGRIFMAERSGAVKAFLNGTVTTVHTVTTTTASEQGLLGITLHPDFASNGKCYIFYTNPDMTRHYLDVIVINTANQVTSVTRVMEFDPIINGFHNGGALLFKGNLLYIAIGESNSAAESTKPDTYRGKILRLTEDGQPAPGNPYYDEPGASRQKRSMWAMGMRNPWRMSLDPVSQKIFVVDVGGNYEEINDVTNPDPAKNYNYGWDQNGRSGPDQATNTIQAAYYYPHPNWGCAITSGVFFNPPATNYPPQYRNRFYFSDWCGDWYRSVDATNPGAGFQEFSATQFGRILGTSVGIDGNIYYFQYGTNGSLWRIEYDNNQAPAIVNQPASASVVAGDPVTFTVAASGATPLSFQWQKNGVNIPNATAATYQIAQTSATDAGSYRCVVTNPIGSVTSNAATLTILPFNARPVPHILTPSASLTWDVLDRVDFSAEATDLEDGTLPASAFRWEIRFFHKDNPTSEHWHPGPVIPNGIKSGSFIADNGGESSPNIWFRIMLFVTDSQGRTGVDSVDIHPNKVELTADASVAGLRLVMGSQGTVPFTKTMVVNSAFTLQAISPQVLGNNAYAFTSWEHGGGAEQSLRVPAVNTTYKANYEISGSLQNPFSGLPINLPGKVEAEDFDTGGEGIAYHDASDNNQGNQYRTTEGVDIEGCSEGGYNIGYVSAGEWLEYTVNVTQPGIYTLQARVATPYTNKTFHVELDGQNISGTIAVPVTNGFQGWQTVSVNTPALTTGVKTLRIVMDASDFNLNYLNFVLAGSGGSAPQVNITSPAANTAFFDNADIVIRADASDLDGTISKVEFFQGTTKLGEATASPYEYTWIGVGVGNYSLTARAIDNQGLATTSAAVPIVVNAIPALKTIPGRIEAEDYDEMSGIGTEGTGDTGGGENIGWVGTGDWLDYHVSVTTAGTYTVAFRVASNPGGGQIQLLSGSTILTSVNVPPTGGWQDWITLTATVTLEAGEQTLRVYASAPDWNLNWMEFSSGISAAHPTESIVKIYPNPTINTLKVGNPKNNGIYKITNIGTSQTTQLRSSTGNLDVSNLAAGTYIVEFYDGAKLIRKKFVKL